MRSTVNAFLLIATLTLSASAQVFSLSVPVRAVAHPVRSFHSIPADQKLLFIADAILQDVNAIDYATTYRGPILHPGQYCENNPVFVTRPCIVNVPRFTGVKIGGAALGVAQWIPIWLGWKNQTYIRTLTVLDFAYATPLAIADVNNIYQLTK